MGYTSTRRLYASELQGDAQVFLLVSVDFAGQAFRWSTKPVNISTASGEVLRFDGGLNELEFETVLQTLTDAPDQTSISLDLLWPVDVAQLVSEGHDLSAARGEMSAWIDGNQYEDRQVLVTGRVRQPTYAAFNEPVSFTIEEAPFEDVALWPPASQRINKKTWPRYRQEESNRPYTQVIGIPGKYVTITGEQAQVAGSRGQSVETLAADGTQTTRLLIAGHRVKSSTVQVYYVGAEGFTPDEGFIDGGGVGVVDYDIAVEYVRDGLGAYVSTVDITVARAEICRASEFHIYWQNDKGTVDGGLIAGDGLTFIRGAGDVMEYVLQRSTLRVDWGRFNAVKQRMNAYLCDFYMNEHVTPWEWISDNILPLVPVSMHSGPDGLYPVWWDWDAKAKDAVEKLTQGPGIVRISGVGYQSQASELRNQITLQYAYDVAEGEYQRAAIHTPAPDLDDTEQITSEFAKRSAAQYGVTAEEVATSDIVSDTATAGKVTNWQIMARAFSHRSVTYEVPQVYAYLELGSVVLLTDAEVHLTDVVALVQGNQINDTGRIDLTLQIVDNSARGQKTTGPNPDTGQADPGDYS